MEDEAFVFAESELTESQHRLITSRMRVMRNVS